MNALPFGARTAGTLLHGGTHPRYKLSRLCTIPIAAGTGPVPGGRMVRTVGWFRPGDDNYRVFICCVLLWTGIELLRTTARG